MYYKDHWVQDLEETRGSQYGFGDDFRCSLSALRCGTAHPFLDSAQPIIQG